MSGTSKSFFSDIRVLDFSQAGPGQLTGVLFADFGADVITVEPPGGASTRRLTGGTLRANYMRNKRSLVLNLKADGSNDVVHPLVESADVLVHNNRPGKMAELGYDYESLRSVNEELIFCSLTGYGETGPYSTRPCYDPHAQAMSGLLWNTGEPDRKASRVGASVISYATAQAAAFAIMGALWYRARTGEGQKLEASLFDTAGSAMGYWYTYYAMTGEEPTRSGHSWDAYCPAGIFATGDDPIYLAIPSDSLWQRFCEAIDKPEWIEHPHFGTDARRLENREDLFAEIESEFADYSRAELLEILIAHDVPASEVQTISEAADDDHLWERGTLSTVQDVNGTDVIAAMPPAHPSKTPASIEQGPPATGEHTENVLSEIGFDSGAIDCFIERGIVRKSS